MARHSPNTPTRLALGFAALAWMGCASAVSQTRFEVEETLLAERDEWRGLREGTVVLRHHVEALVDVDRRGGTSRLVFHLVAARFEPGPITLGFAVPSQARRVQTDVRLVSASATFGTNDQVAEWRDDSGLDPSVNTVHISLPEPPPEGVTEAILTYDVPGLLQSDVRDLDFAEAPTAEVLIRYDLPSSAAGAFQTTLPGARPVVTSRDGRTLIALLAKNLPARTEGRTLARYVTRAVTYVEGTTDVASSWGAATAAYQRGLVDNSPSLEDGFACPFAAPDIPSALSWVQARKERRNFFGDPWNQVSSLPQALSNNALSAVMKVHLLAWLLRDAKLPFAFAMARGPQYAALDPAFPVPSAFESPLLYAPTLGLFLDPACAECKVGEVRAALAGGQAILVPPVGESPLLPLPKPASVSTP
jgi:hypothetical protein